MVPISAKVILVLKSSAGPHANGELKNQSNKNALNSIFRLNLGGIISKFEMVGIQDQQNWANSLETHSQLISNQLAISYLPSFIRIGEYKKEDFLLLSRKVRNKVISVCPLKIDCLYMLVVNFCK